MSPRHRREVALGASAAAVLSALVVMLGAVLAGVVVFSAAPRDAVPAGDGGSLLLPMRSAEAAAPARIAARPTPRVAPVVAVTYRPAATAHAAATVRRARRTTLRPTRRTRRTTPSAPASPAPRAQAPAPAAPSATTIAAPAPPLAPAPAVQQQGPTMVASTTEGASAPTTRRVAVTAPVATTRAERPRRWDRRRHEHAPPPPPATAPTPPPAPPAPPAPAPPQQQAPVPAPPAPQQGGRPWRPDGERDPDRGGHHRDPRR